MPQPGESNPDVNRQALDRLLGIGAESATLDYKQSLNLDDRQDVVEIAKDIGAMMPRGGHLVIGADNAGQVVAGGGVPASQIKKFDEASLRGKVKRYLGTDFDLHTAVHDLRGVHFGVIHVPPHPQGFLAFQADGSYPDPRDASKQRFAFREGDIYIRQGTASVRANQAEITKIIEEAVARRAAAPAELTWQGDDDVFEAAVATAFRTGDDVGIRRFLERCAMDGRRLIETGQATPDEVGRLFDRVICLAALALRWDRHKWVEPAVDTLVKLYGSAITDHGSPRHDLGVPGHQVMMGIVNRVLGLGALVVEAEQWWAIPILVLRHPDSDIFRSGLYTNWIRHTTTEAARANALTYNDSLGRMVDSSYLEHALSEIAALKCVNSDAPDKDRFRVMLAQFDALATIAVWGLAPGDHDHPYYPWHRAYEPDRYEPALVRLITDHELRRMIYPHDDRALATLLRHLEKFSRAEFARFGGGWPHLAPAIRRFLERNGS